MTVEEMLFLAFKAGFEYSGEGYNGEYYCYSEKGLLEVLKAQFEAWKEEEDYPLKEKKEIK